MFRAIAAVLAGYGVRIARRFETPFAGRMLVLAVVGMGAVFAGAAHAPLTAIAIVYELTGDVRIVLPLAIGCLLSTAVSRRLHEPNIYVTELLERGVDVGSRRHL